MQPEDRFVKIEHAISTHRRFIARERARLLDIRRPASRKSKGMNPRHAAALGHVGWYLMVPPVIPNR